MIQISHTEHCEDDLVIFEIIAESIKQELDKIIRTNHQYKTDYYRFNRKKFLLTYCFDSNNSNNQYELNAYLDEIKTISSYKDYNPCFEKANALITSTTSFISVKSNKLLEKLKLNYQPNYAQALAFNNTNNILNNQQNNWQIQPQSQPQIQTVHLQAPIVNVVTNQQLHTTETTQNLTTESDNDHYTRELSDFLGTVHENLEINNDETTTIDLNLTNFNAHLNNQQQQQQPPQQQQQSSDKPNKPVNTVHHRQSHNKRFKCDQCGKDFGFKHHLTRHLLKHNGEKPHVCEFCGKSFSDVSNFSSHKKSMHSNNDPEVLKFECEVCHKRFQSQSYLNSHSYTHTDVRNHKCDKCENSFKSVNSLRAHIASVHTTERPFVCDFCGIAFKAKSDLGMHVKRHMGDKRFECKVCGKRFFESTDLKDHLDTHETVSRHECVHCKEKFLTRPRMWHHIKVKHKDPKKPIQKVTHGDKDDQEEEENNETEIEDENASHKSFDQIKIEPDSCTDDDEKESLSNKRNKAKKDLNNVKVKKVKLNFSKK
jgi:uncharacterized Zn-finger protein